MFLNNWREILGDCPHGEKVGRVRSKSPGGGNRLSMKQLENSEIGEREGERKHMLASFNFQTGH